MVTLSRVSVLLATLTLLPDVHLSAEESGKSVAPPVGEYAILGGYGITHRGMGATRSAMQGLQNRTNR